MDIALSILSRLCIAWVIVYLFFSFLSAAWVGKRHGRSLVLLEFQPRRARGAREAGRARLLKWMGLCAVLALPVGIASAVASVILS